MDSAPNLFALPPGADFVGELIHGLDQRFGDRPGGLGSVELWVNTERTRRALIGAFEAGPPRLFPRIRLVTDLAPLVADAVAPGVSMFRRQLDLHPLVARLLDFRPELTAGQTAWDLTESLALLFSEMADEAVGAGRLAALDVEDAAGYWQTSLRFLNIAAVAEASLDQASRQRAVADRLAERWSHDPPGHPVVLAGSTGSRGPVFRLMQALLSGPMGHVVLPGFDFHMGPEIWASFDGSAHAEEHPQFRFHRLMRAAGIGPADIRPWTDRAATGSPRNRLLSLALRPAPVTDAWLRDGPALGDLPPVCAPVSLIEAPGPRAEATAIAACMRAAAEENRRVALITPDRRLARRVAAALDRWGIIPDDSAGIALGDTPPGRLLRMLAGAMVRPPDTPALIALLSNPVVASGGDRPGHLNAARALETHLRSQTILHPDPTRPSHRPDAAAVPSQWFDWISAVLAGLDTELPASLDRLLTRLLAFAEHLARGPDGAGPGELWAGEAGGRLADLMARLGADAVDAGPFAPADFAHLLEKALAQEQAREPTTPHPGVMIWGTLEARVQAVDLAILAGLNEGVWPRLPDPDPWLSRDMRAQAGLLSPERRIGLAAHDFQTAAGAPEIVLSRAVRDDEAMTVPARWLNRLTNLLAGLPETGGDRALAQMQARGHRWMDVARGIETRFVAATPAPRPSPAPPARARPDRLSVTQIATLKRDPYAIYARKVLGLKPLNPLRPVPDARMRGTLLHRIFERFVRDAVRAPGNLTEAALAKAAEGVLAGVADFPMLQRLWLGQITGTAAQFIAEERARWAAAVPTYFEVRGEWPLTLADGRAFTLTGVADRLDIAGDGAGRLYDYKSGRIPTETQQTHYDRQLFLLGLMAEAGAFRDSGPVPPVRVAALAYLGIGRSLAEVSAKLSKTPLADAEADIRRLLGQYYDPAQGYTSRAYVERTRQSGDFDHLARLGEWNESTPPTLIEVGR